MNNNKTLRIIESDYLEEAYNLEFEAHGSIHELSYNDDDNEYYYDYRLYSTLLYESDNNIILFSNQTFESIDEEALHDINKVVVNCLLEEKPKFYIREQTFDSIHRLKKDTHYILEISQFCDNTICSCLIDDLKLYEKVIETYPQEKVNLINDYINESISKSKDNHSWICSEIKDTIYKKYEIKEKIYE